jgi:hypothetical protein
MKTLSRTFTYVALAAVAIVAVISLHAFGMASTQEKGKQYKFHKQIGGPGPNQYAELRDPKDQFQNRLDTALNTLKEHGGVYRLKFLCKDTDTSVDYNPHGQDAAHGHPNCHAKTVKVTKYEGANIAAADASVANDPNAIQHLYANDAANIDAVCSLFKGVDPCK